MESLYQKVTDLILGAGRRIVRRAGSIQDIGITKQFLTEEDVRIERDLKDLVEKYGPHHVVYAEEENDTYTGATDVWAIDPISSTKNFISGLPHYAIVATHLHDGEAKFAIAYDPAVDELFTAIKGQGVYMNSQKLVVKPSNSDAIILRVSSQWKDQVTGQKVKDAFTNTPTIINSDSLVVNYMDIARGRAAGLVSLAKDSFPNFAGTLLLNEAGGVATNIDGSTEIHPDDRMFIAAREKSVHIKLLERVREAVIEG